MRILVGGTVAAVMAVVVGVFLLGGGSSVSFANAADRMQGKALRANVTMQMSAGDIPMTLRGTMLQSADMRRVRMDLQADMAGTSVSQTLVIIGQDLWMGSAAFESLLPDGKKWVRAGEDAVPELSSMTLEELMAFCAAATDIEQRGETEIDGVRATHYVGTVDFAAAASKLGRDVAAYEELFGDGEAVMPIEVWLDSSQNALRMKMKMAVEGSEVAMTMDGFEYDVDVSSIKAPPADEVVSDEEVGILSQG